MEMENIPATARKRKGRSRGTKVKRAKICGQSVSARLNPDFDLVGNVMKTLGKSGTQNPLKQIHQKEEPCSLTSLEMSLDSLSLNNMSDAQEIEDTITSSFKTTMLNTTLRFIKDPTRLTLTYPEMPLANAQFLYSLIHPPNQEDCDVGFGFKSMYAKLFEGMKSLKSKYDFEVSFGNTSSLLTTKLTMTKVPKANSKPTVDHISREDSNSSNLTKPSSLKHKSKQHLIQNLPESFMSSTLEKLLDFMEDPYKASLEFKHVSVRESRFLECVTVISRSEELYKLFSTENEVFLKRLSRKIRRGEWSLRLNVGKLCKRTGLRTIMFTKSPTYGSEITPERNVVKTAIPTQQLSKVDEFAIALQISIKNDGYEIRQHTNVCINGHDDRTVAFQEKSLNKEQIPNAKPMITATASNTDQVSDSQNQNSGSKKNLSSQYKNIFQSAGCQRMDVTDFEEKEREHRPVTPPPTTWKGRLMKGFATPLESDKAERMMRLMGWEGGALGARGEGIVEPIMPALHLLSSKAGLGHIVYSAADFRMNFLNAVLGFLQSPSTNTSVSFPLPVTKKEGRFIKQALDGFNDRRRIGLSRPEEQALVRQICEVMTSEPHPQIGFQISKDQRSLHLEKVTGRIIPKKTKKNKKKKSKAAKIDQIVIEDDIIQVDDITDKLELICPTRKSAKYLALKITFLEKIRELVDRTSPCAVDSPTNAQKMSKIYPHLNPKL